MSERNKAIIRRWTEELWNRGDFASAREFVADDLQFRANQMSPAEGLRSLQDTVAGVRTGFPDGKYRINELVAEGDTVVQRWTFRGTHQGEWAGIAATGRQVEFTGTATYHFRNGRIVEHVADWDALRMMQQLGVVSS